MKEKFPLDTYKCSEDIKNKLRPIVQKIKDNDIIIAEKKIARLALAIINELEKKNISPNHANSYFVILDTYIGDNYKRLKMSKSICELLIEGMTLHDLGKSFGADINYMKSLANKIVGKK